MSVNPMPGEGIVSPHHLPETIKQLNLRIDILLYLERYQCCTKYLAYNVWHRFGKVVLLLDYQNTCACVGWMFLGEPIKVPAMFNWFRKEIGILS